ncbi:hypothetical protein JZ751_029782 [Albula glossodonta]|uniref:Uncharacterized protein n=1 Tax=Albula glossodonta TaxID=121402 RepID=A0A8T2NB04_9TELE|nr:hypothetical protein JZ751_029782 [Albula glossodonta]
MKAMERNGHTRCAEDMESKAASRGQQYCCRTFANVLSLLFSVASLAYCVFLSVQTSEIRARVAELDNGNAELLYRPVPGFAMDKLDSLIHERVDQLLSQLEARDSTGSGQAVCTIGGRSSRRRKSGSLR